MRSADPWYNRLVKNAHDPNWDADIAAAQAIVQGWRHSSSKLSRVLWLLSEGVETGLGLDADILDGLKRFDDLEAAFAAAASKLGQLDAMAATLARIEAILNGDTPAGPPIATSGIISINGTASTIVGDNRQMDTILDSDPPATLAVEWDDSKGAITTAPTDAWSGDNDAAGTVGPHPSDPTKGVFTPNTPGTVNVKVVGTNADGTTVELIDSVTVSPGDAVTGKISLTPGV